MVVRPRLTTCLEQKGIVYDKYEVHTWVSVTFQVMEDNTVLWAYHKDTWMTRPKC